MARSGGVVAPIRTSAPMLQESTNGQRHDTGTIQGSKVLYGHARRSETRRMERHGRAEGIHSNTSGQCDISVVHDPIGIVMSHHRLLNIAAGVYIADTG